MRFIDAEQIGKALAYPALIAGLDRYHREDTQAMDDVLLAQTVDEESTNHLLIRAAWQYDKAIGTKLVTVFPNNPTQNASPAVQAIYVVFDGANGTPTAVIEGTVLTYWKTAADSALGTQYLARDDVHYMLMVGAGKLAPHLIAAHCAARPSITHVSIWNRTPEKAKDLAKELKLNEVTIEYAEDLESAARKADLISCATMATQPIIQGSWLSPGTHLDLVGAFTPDMREADDDAVSMATIFVDCRETTIGEVGEISIPIQNGTITERDVVADLYDLCRGKHPGRSDKNEITLYKNGGGGHLDLMTTRFLLEQIA